MKKAIIPISLLFVAGLAHAQATSTENYVQTRVYLEPVTTTSSTAKQLQTVQYLDGLGRAKQVVNVKASSTAKDVVSHVEYDAFGRQVKDYLPVPQSGTQNGAIYTSPLGNATAIYGSEKIYAEKILESSPLDRPLQQIQVGNDWANKPVNLQYDLNNAGDNVKKYVTATAWDATNKIYNVSLQQSQNYAANILYKNTVIDEDGNKTIEFKNEEGQLILVRKELSSTQNTDTYYVYNEYNQLSYVIPPLASVTAVNQVTLDNLCYQYKYDGKNRLVEKKLPGKGWEYMVYDKADRLILTQDANLRSQGKWLFTKYDQFSRPIYTGILDSSPGRIQQVNAIEGLATNTEVRTSSSWNNSGMDVYYTNNTAYPTTNFKLLSVNYYDTYPSYSFNPPFPGTIYGKQTLTDNPATIGKSTKSLPVMTFVKNIEDDNWTKNYNYYDTKGRTIGTHSINYLGGYTKTESDLDFAGAVQQTKTYHKRLSSDTEKVITETFTYDNQNRLLVHKHKVDNNTEEILAQNTYNELSQLVNKKVGNTISNPLQDIDYTYNIRGWLLKVNDPAYLAGKLFGYEIKYNNPSNTSLSTGKYNGNIAEIDWRKNVEFGNMGILKRYNYSYDKLNRLTGAIFSNPDNSIPVNNLYDELISYDLNGNIVQLKRNAPSFYGTAELIDDLYYNYDGNRLNSVNDDNSNPSGYEGGGNSIEYDYNGNMYNHPDKLIDEIAYNHLNLPNAFRINSNANKILYLYRADGTKLRKAAHITYSDQDVFGTVTEYLDGFHYLTTQGISKNDDNPMDYAYEQEAFISQMLPSSPTPELQFFPTAEGFYDYVNNKYIYQYKDHLGNVRISYKGNIYGEVEITDQNDYYPFGMSFIRTAEEQAFFGTASYQNYKYNGKELQETGMYDYGARFYMPDIGRWGVVDPLAEQYRRWSPYNYAVNNPIMFIDPDGRGIESTHTDKFGNVVMVTNDGDNGVYKHSGDTQETLKELGKSYNSESNTSAGGERMGETEFWDEFVDPDTNMAAGTIHFGNEQSWDPLVANANEYSKKVGLEQTMEESKLYQGLDIKNNKDWSSEGPMTGRLLNGKYATGRSAGNYLAGLNGVTSTLRGFNISGTTYMKMAGAYQKGLISTPYKLLNYNIIGSVLLFGNSYGPAPYYGEEPYSGRRILEGIKAGEKANNK